MSDAEVPAGLSLAQVHDVACNALYALIRLHDLATKFHNLSEGQKENCSVVALWDDYMTPLFDSLQSISKDSGFSSSMQKLTAARMELSRGPLGLQGMSG